MSEEEKEFKKQCDETLYSIYSKINEEDFEIEQDFNEDAYLQYIEEVTLEKRILEEEENE